jgi:transcription elongation factor Elf1
MNELQETDIGCPYCGELITLLIDLSIETQQYIEDCQVCCQPIEVAVSLGSDDSVQVDVRGENE